VEHLAIFMVCVGILALIWTSVRTDRRRDRRWPGKMARPSWSIWLTPFLEKLLFSTSAGASHWLAPSFEVHFPPTSPFVSRYFSPPSKRGVLWRVQPAESDA